MPAPRECAKMCSVNNRLYLIGGMNHETIKEISRIRIDNFYSNNLDHLEISWQNLGAGTKENIKG
jgi:hypothetical protein